MILNNINLTQSLREREKQNLMWLEVVGMYGKSPKKLLEKINKISLVKIIIFEKG